MSISLPQFHLPQNPVKKISAFIGLAGLTTVSTLGQLPAHAQQLANHTRQQVVELPATFVCTETTARGNKFEYEQIIHTKKALDIYKKWCAGEIPGPDHQYVTNGVLTVQGNRPSTGIQHPQTLPTPPVSNTTFNVYAAQCGYSKPWTDAHGNPSRTHERFFTYTSQPFNNQTPNAVAIVESAKNFCTERNGTFSVENFTGRQIPPTTTYIDRQINNH